MSSNIVISVQHVSKSYRIWRDPAARLKVPLWDMLGIAIPKSVRPKFLQTRVDHTHDSRYYKDLYALKDVSFEIHRGESVGIIGRNGSGKSTLLQIIAGTLQSTAGSTNTTGRIAALLELGSGFNPDFTGQENIYLNGAVLGLTSRQIEQKYSTILEFADIGDFINQPVKTYSSGMTMRLAFAVQVAVEPDILIVDEALGVGDEAFQHKCYARLKDLKAKGTTLLFVSHDAGTVINICDRALLLDKGALVKAGLPKTVVTAYHQLLYAPRGESTPAGLPPLSHSHQLTEERHIAQQNGTLDESSYDPNLKAGNSVSYADAGGTIEQVDLLNAAGAIVNQLTHGCTYRLRLKAIFHRTSFGVFFGSTISTLTGTSISGFNTPQIDQPIPIIEAGQTVVWDFTFRCALLPATYAIEVGIGGVVSDNPQGFIHRIVDAWLFRVQPVRGSAVTVLVNLDQKGSIQYIPNPSKNTVSV